MSVFKPFSELRKGVMLVLQSVQKSAKSMSATRLQELGRLFGRFHGRFRIVFRVPETGQFCGMSGNLEKGTPRHVLESVGAFWSAFHRRFQIVFRAPKFGEFCEKSRGVQKATLVLVLNSSGCFWSGAMGVFNSCCVVRKVVSFVKRPKVCKKQFRQTSSGVETIFGALS